MRRVAAAMALMLFGMIYRDGKTMERTDHIERM